MPAPERAMTIIAVRVARADTKDMEKLRFRLCCRNRTSRAVFPANILIVAEDDKSRVARAPEMFGYKFLLACSPGID
jgi:hypothetical protein